MAEADAVVNFAAETHVDRSILEPAAFLRTGVVGVHVLLEAVRVETRAGPRRRADRAALPPGLHRRGVRLHRGGELGRDGCRWRRARPYAAAKAAGELLARAYHVTYGLDVVITRGSNTYGPYQHPEKLIPLFVTNALDDQPLPLYGDGLQRRDWLYVERPRRGGRPTSWSTALPGEVYNVPGAAELHEPRRGRASPRPPRQALVAGPLGGGPARPRPALRDGRRAAPRPRVDQPGRLRRRAGRDRRLVPRPPGLVAGGPRAGLGRLLRAPVRRPDRDVHARRRPAGGARLMRVAVTGAGGRLGRALVAALEDAPFTGPARAAGLEPPGLRPRRSRRAAARVVGRDAPDVVVHAAAWTDVDGCAREPGARDAPQRASPPPSWRTPAPPSGSTSSSSRRTRSSTAGATDGRGYAADDRPAPANPYGASKLAGETAAQAAYLRRGGVLAADPAGRGARAGRSWRSSGRRGSSGRPATTSRPRSWAAADRALAAGEPLRVVGDEIGSPTYAPDLADAIVELLAAGSFAGVHHVVNAGAVTRAGWARAVLAAAGLPWRSLVEVPAAAAGRGRRPSPAWAVLAPTPLPSGEPLRPWEAAFADYVPAAPARRGRPGTRR